MGEIELEGFDRFGGQPWRRAWYVIAGEFVTRESRMANLSCLPSGELNPSYGIRLVSIIH